MKLAPFTTSNQLSFKHGEDMYTLVVTLKDPPTYPLDCVVLRNGEAICIVKHDNCKVPTTCIPDVVLTTEIELLASQFMTLCLMHRAMLKQGRDE